MPDPAVLSPIVVATLGSKLNPDDAAALAEAVKNPRIVQEIMDALNAEAKKNELAGHVALSVFFTWPLTPHLRFEYVKRIHVTMDPFTVEDNTLTPTLKLRRKDAYAKFKKELDGLYTLGEPTNGEKSKL